VSATRDGKKEPTMATKTLLPLVLLATLAGGVQAADSNQIATLCQERWLGQKGMQSYCIKVNRDYYDWLQYIGKRVYRNPELRELMAACEREHAPDYRQVSDCYWDDAE
jgi:hypothetical protein